MEGGSCAEACKCVLPSCPNYFSYVHRIIFSFAVLSVLLMIGLHNPRLLSTSINYLYSLGFGTVTPLSVVNNLNLRGPGGLILTILIANCPQLLLSFTYLCYNSLFTSMCLAREWNSYAVRRQQLRVTSPEEDQRSTYWLQLPYRYSLPLLAASALLHWLVSQSIFLARVTVTNEDGTEATDESISTCGYSSIALIFVIGLASLLLFVVIGFGFGKVKCDMPLAGSCSAAISAACHPPEADVNAGLKGLQWGVVKHYRARTESADQDAGHCCFTSLGVTRPIDGKVYA